MDDSIEERDLPRSSKLPWILSMEWHDVLFLHWPVPKESLRPFIPDQLSIETYDGSAWLGIVPFTMSHIRPRLCPSLPYVSNFPEINIRTYVTDGTASGVWFHSLDASSWISVNVARFTYSLNYYHADMNVHKDGNEIRYRSRRESYESGEFLFNGSYTPTTNSTDEPPSLTQFLTSRYYLFSSDNRGNLYRGLIRHDPWELMDADYDIDRLSISNHPAPPDESPASILYDSHQKVHAWLPEKIN